MLVLLFNLLLAGASGYALWRGGGPERIVALAFVIAALASYLAPSPAAGGFREIDFGLLAVDLALLAILVWVALWANRFWPIWIAAFQVLVLLTHLTMAYQHDILPIVYFVIVSRIAYLMLVMLVVGTVFHLRRVKRHGSDPDWTRGFGGVLPPMS